MMMSSTVSTREMVYQWARKVTKTSHRARPTPRHPSHPRTCKHLLTGMETMLLMKMGWVATMVNSSTTTHVPHGLKIALDSSSLKRWLTWVTAIMKRPSLRWLALKSPSYQTWLKRTTVERCIGKLKPHMPSKPSHTMTLLAFSLHLVQLPPVTAQELTVLH